MIYSRFKQAAGSRPILADQLMEGTVIFIYILNRNHFYLHRVTSIIIFVIFAILSWH